MVHSPLDTVRRFSALSKEDIRKLQVLQKRVLRLKCRNHDLHTPTVELLNSCGDLSVHQLGAYHTVLQVFKIIKSGQPTYLSEKLLPRKPSDHGIFPQRHLNTIKVRGHLMLSRSGFFYRGAQLWNSLPPDLRSCSEISTFRKELRRWIRATVPVKP